MLENGDSTLGRSLIELAEAPVKGLPLPRVAEAMDGPSQEMGRLAGWGRLGSADEGGVQAHIDLADGGYLSVSVYPAGRFDPLIVRYGLKPDGAALAVGSCCMTDIDCGGLKCTTAEDPCPSGVAHEEPWYAGERTESLFAEERDLLHALGALIARLTINPLERDDLIVEVRRIRSYYPHRELVMTLEPDVSGAWYDWIVRLSTGGVVRITLCTNKARRSPIWSHADDAWANRIRTRASLIPSLDGDLVLQARVLAD